MLAFWNFFLEKRQFTILLIVALIAAGLYSLVAIPKESSPEVEVPIGIVSTVLPGAAARDVEKLVTKKIEDEVASISNLSKLTSVSGDGSSVITVEFDANANLDEAIADLKDAVDRAKPSLPEDATEPNVIRINFADEPVLIISVSGDYSPLELTTLGEDVSDVLKTVSGVAKVDVSGVRNREVTVVIQKEALLLYGITLGEIVGALNAQNSALPIGAITVSDVDYAVRFEGDIADTSDVANLPVLTRGDRSIYLRDIAEVYDGLEKASSYSRVSIDGAPSENALTLYVYKKRGGNVVATSDLVKAKLDELQGTLLSGGAVTVTFDRGKLVQKDLSELTRVGFETVLLVMLSLILTIGWRESLVAGLSIPLSFVIAFIGLLASGNTINFVSLFSLILAVGILVDSGIVVTEAIHTRYKRYGDSLRAARESIREYAWPLIAGTMTTVAVFVPLFFLSGVTGKFIASIPFTIIFVLLASIFVALGFVPLLAIMFTKKSMNRMEELQEKYNDIIRTWYMNFLRNFLRARRLHWVFLGTLFIAFIFAMSLPSLGLVKVIFFPGGDNDFFYVEIEKPQGSTLASTDLSARVFEEILYENPDIASFVTTIGSGSTFGSGGSGSKLANITINLHEDREKSSLVVAQEVRQSLADIRDVDWRVTEPQNGPPTGAPIVITFRGDDLDNLERAVARGEKLLKEIPGSRDTTTSMKDDNIEFVFTLDKAKAHELGFTPTQIAGILRTALTGSKATTINKDADDIDVVVKLNLSEPTGDPDRTAEGTIDDIRQIPIETRHGTVLLGSILDVRLQKSNSSIRREDRERVATISGYVQETTTALEVTDAFKARIDELNLPEGIRVTFGGETEEVDRSFQEMGIALLAGLMLMLAILVLEFNSFRYTLYLLLTVPLSLIGVFSGLALAGEPLSFPSMLGVIALAGIIINHAIILLDSMYHLIRNPEGRSLEDIVVDSAAIRLRPIFLTTITTVLGMVPLAGASDLWGPLAFSVMFGLMFAMVLTLVLIPLLFYRWPGKKFHATLAASNGKHNEAQAVLNLPPEKSRLALPEHGT